MKNILLDRFLVEMPRKFYNVNIVHCTIVLLLKILNIAYEIRHVFVVVSQGWFERKGQKNESILWKTHTYEDKSRVLYT